MADTIKTGDKLPAVKLKVLTDNGMEDVDTGDLFAGKKAVLFSVPGAFTPTCSAKHLPGFIQHADALKAKGIDLIACTAVNDAFVMKAWAEGAGAGESVMMLADGNAEFADALGLTLDATGFGLGTRGKRFALLIDDGTVTDVQIDEGEFKTTSAEYMLERI